MKKTKFKNYIAFTLAEMTLVLLITSVIAATATPMITSSVTNFQNQYNFGSSGDTPWMFAGAYKSGGAIYNNQKADTAFVAINHRPSGNPSSYGYPSLLINTRITGNVVNAPQITVCPISGTKNKVCTYLSMDQYANVSFTYGSYSPFFSSNDNIGMHNVIIGSNIENHDSLSDDALYFNKSIHMGYGISAQYANNLINIGSNLTLPYWETNSAYPYANGSITLGSDIYTYATGGTPPAEYYTPNNIRIGHYAGAYSSYSASSGIIVKAPTVTHDNTINIGHYSGYATSGKNLITIGPYAAYGYVYPTNFQKIPTNNIFVGLYAGAGVSTNTTTVGVSAKMNNIYIGKYAGSVNLTAISSKPYLDKQYNINIGSYAGSIDVFTTQTPKTTTWTRDYNINIGNYAGYTGYSAIATRNISIGCRAGYYQAPSGTGVNQNYGNIFIGYLAGRFAYANNSIIIAGSNAGAGSFIGTTSSPSNGNIDFITGVPRVTTSLIAIGNGAAKQSSLQGNSIFIGNHAGAYAVNSTTTGGFGSYGNNIGIGAWACSGTSSSSIFSGRNKICLGYGTLRSTLSATDTENSGSYNVWTPTDGSAQMVIGAITSTTVNSITMYAGTVYGPSQKFHTLSDRRLKENIVPSKYGLKDIRKVNVVDYNFKKDALKTPKIGVIAQEFRKIFPMSVTKEPNFKFFCINSEWMDFTMVNATKEVDKNLQQLKKEVQEYINDFMGLKSKVAKMEKQAEQIKKENAEMKKHLAEINKKLK